MLGQAATTNQHDCNMRPTSFVGLQKKLFYAANPIRKQFLGLGEGMVNGRW